MLVKNMLYQAVLHGHIRPASRSPPTCCMTWPPN